MKRFLFALILSISVFTGSAQIKMPHVFSDHMVLQRNIAIPLWGKAAPSSSITIEFANQHIITRSDSNGSWEAKLPAFQAGGPYTLTVSETAKPESAIQFTDVLIGDVWIASGQSNMEWQVQQAEGADSTIAHAANEQLRLFFVPHNKSIEPLENTLPAQWAVCDSVSVKTISAVAYYFATQVQKEINVPIGILQSTWGGTPVEAWTSREMLLSQPLMRDRVLANDSITPAHFVKDSLDLIEFWDIVYHPRNGVDSIYSKPGFDDHNWKKVPVPGVISEWEPKFYEGMIWLRKTIELPKNFTGKDLQLNLGHPEMNYSLYFNGTEICKTQWNANLNHSYSIPKNIVHKGENVIAVRIAALWGGGGLNAPGDAIYLSNGKEKYSLTGDWLFQKDLEDQIPQIHNYQYYPSYLYNAMIEPIVPYGAKGFLWYQGEANDSIAYNYRYLLPDLISDWRIRWQQGYLPFLLVQLPNYMKAQDQPVDEKWAVMRESQSKTLNEPNTGMTCIIDLGNPDNIHPTNKIEVGTRLANVALKQVYSQDRIASGPVLKSFTVNGNEVRLKFTETGAGLKTSDGKSPTGFAIAGNDQQFYWAEASIDGDEVILKSEQVAAPVAVRYAWANNPQCNLINSINLPAIPFRTDNWKVVTQK